MKVISKEAMALLSEARAGKPSLAAVQAGTSEPIYRIDATLMTARNRATALVLPTFQQSTRAMLAGEPIQVFNNGQIIHEFTYVDDIVESLIRILDKPATPDPDFDPAQPDPATSWAPHRLFNIGNSNPTSLMNYIEALESELDISATKEFLPMQLGDVPSTAAD